MIEIREAKPAELGRVRALWQAVFGDEEAYIDRFLARAGAGEILVLYDAGELCSMAAIPAVELVGAQGKREKAAYVYALATAPERRGCGYAGMLLHYVDFTLRERGVEWVTVVPAEAGLHRFFASAGFEEGFTTSVWTGELPKAAADTALEPLESGEYGTLREELLSGTVHVGYDEGLLEFQASAGGLFRVQVQGCPGCLAAEREEEKLILKELLLPGGDALAAAAAAGARLGAKCAEIRLPAGWPAPAGSRRWEFGMVKRLTPGGTARAGLEGAYLGLAFD